MNGKKHWIGTLAWGAPYSLAVLGAANLFSDGHVWEAAMTAIPATFVYSAILIGLWTGKITF